MKKEFTILYYGLFGWRKEDAIADNNRTFTCYKECGLGAFVVAIVLLILLESPLIHLLLMHRSTWLTYLHSLLVVYGIVWLLGDYQAFKKKLISVSPETVQITLGMRRSFSIQRSNIHHAQLGQPRELNTLITVQKGQFETKRKLPGYNSFAALGEPNLHIVLKNPISIKGKFGQQLILNRIGLSVDQADQFVVEVNRPTQSIQVG